MGETKTFYADQIAALVNDREAFDALYHEAGCPESYIRHCWLTHQDRFKPIRIDVTIGGSKWANIESHMMLIHDNESKEYWFIPLARNIGADTHSQSFGDVTLYPSRPYYDYMIKDTVGTKAYHIKDNEYVTFDKLKDNKQFPSSKWM